VLIARIYEVFPLVCPICAGQMRLIAFITDRAEVRKILDHIGVDSLAQRISPARGPPLWDDCDAQAGKGVDVEPDWVRIRPNRTRLPSRPAHSLVKGKPGIRTRPGVGLRLAVAQAYRKAGSDRVSWWRTAQA
jgi:hypothetical protein